MLEFKQEQFYQEKCRTLEKKTKWFSKLRLGLALLTILFLICLFSTDLWILFGSLTVVSLVLLIVLIGCTNPSYRQFQRIKNIHMIYLKHHTRREGHYDRFTDDGRKWMDPADQTISDLDLLGAKSLYQYLSSAKSFQGRKFLARQLTHPQEQSPEFTDTIVFLSQEEQTVELEAALSQMDAECSDTDVEQWLRIFSEKRSVSRWIWVWMFVSFSAFFLILILSFFYHYPFYYAFILLVFNWIVTKIFTQNPLFSTFAGKYQKVMDSYKEFKESVFAFQTEDPYLCQIRKRIFQNEKIFSKAKRLLDILSYRKNVLLQIIGNAFFMDVWILRKMNLTEEELQKIQKVIDDLSWIEVMISFANIGLDQEVYTKGNFSDVLSFENGYHPLVSSCVSNSFTLEQGVILTGSNMSGKTTFERMIGINQILFNAGSIVCASSWSAPKAEVLTSLRVHDRLQEGISTFYAEIECLKRMMEASKKKNVLILIDEILKGTNTKDRIMESKEIIMRFCQEKIPFIITTHDFELCEIPGISNYHFDEFYQDGKILFDYVLKKGRSTSSNAMYLLQMAGVIETSK